MCLRFSETLNQQARSYLTVLTNNFNLRIVQWQHRTLRAELQEHPLAKQHKPLLKFLVGALARQIAGAKESELHKYKDPIVREYCVATDQLYQEILARHQGCLVEALEQPHGEYGIFDCQLITKNLHLYLTYAIQLQRWTEEKECDTEQRKKRKRHPS